VLYAIGNSGDANLKVVAAELVADQDQTVADAARWAKARL
jgi:epoxyqueuosine reductase